MNIVKNKLSDKVKPIWFNTSQFSQFNMDEQLSVSLLLCLISEFGKADEVTQNTGIEIDEKDMDTTNRDLAGVFGIRLKMNK